MERSFNGDSHPPPPQPPTTFLILFLTLSIFSTTLFPELSLLLLLHIISFLLPPILSSLLPILLNVLHNQILLRSPSDFPLFLPFYLFSISSSLSLFVSYSCYRPFAWVDLSTEQAGRSAREYLLKVMMAWLPCLMMITLIPPIYMIYGGLLARLVDCRSAWQDQVITTPSSLISPTTSCELNSIWHTNAQDLRVYIYPISDTFTNQVQYGLSSVSKLQHFPFEIAFYPTTSQKFFSFLPEFPDNIVESIANKFWFFVGGMASSPRSVLDPVFQCEAVPILLEDSPSSSLVHALHHTLAGRLLTSKRPSMANLTLAASRLWDCTQRLSVFDHGKCLYSFEFTFAPDVEKVVTGGPWYINGGLLLISRMNPNQSIEQLPFAYTKLWVRCYDLPPKCFIKKYAAAIGNSLGSFCETDLPPEDPDEAKLLVRKLPTVRKYMRVKFEFNLYGPLKSSQGIKICNANGVVVEEHISRLTYERLPHTCFRCGFLGHLVEGCTFKGPLLYGEWIRAERFFRINLQSNTSQKNLSTNNEGQCSTSQQVENRVTRVSNVAELVNAMVNDPTIIKVDFSRARAEGSLPVSKGKAPILSPILDITPIPKQSSCLIPFSNVSPPKTVSPRTVYGPSVESIMGPAPMFMRLQGSPLGSDHILIDSDEGQFASYLNSITAGEDPFAPNASRCLFKSDSSIKELPSPPKIPSPNLSRDATVEIGDSSRHLSNIFKEEIRKLPASRKRAPGNPQTPRPKRGRQSSTSDAA